MTTPNEYDVTIDISRSVYWRNRRSVETDRHIVRAIAYAAKDAVYQARVQLRRTHKGGKLHTVSVAPSKGGKL